MTMRRDASLKGNGAADNAVTAKSRARDSRVPRYVNRPPVDKQALAAIDRALHRECAGLNRWAAHWGAAGVFVFFLRQGTRVQMISSWPEALEPRAAPAKLPVCLDPLPETITANHPLGDFLRYFAPNARSFLVSRSGEPGLQAVVAFGLGEAGPSPIVAWEEVARSARLLALATWCFHQIHALRSELTTVSERLGQRKLVERAKGLLQVKHGWSEQEAYEHLRRLSRQRRISMAAVAESLTGSPV
jgi:hypothetical protein